MVDGIQETGGRIIPHLPGWLCLVGGMVLVAVTVLGQPWAQCRLLGWQLRVVQAQARCLDQQARSYRCFSNAVATQDPVAIQRLAYHHLGLKPVGAAVVGTQGFGGHAGAQGAGFELVANPIGEPWLGGEGVPGVGVMPETIESWLHTPLPHVDPAGEAWAGATQTRLMRLTTGPIQNRLALFGAGALCLTGGLVWGSGSRRETD